MFASAILLIPALVAAPPKPLPLVQAVDEWLDQYDLGGTFPAPPPLATKDRASFTWLFEGLQASAREIPFKAGHPSRKEAVALLEILQGSSVPDSATTGLLALLRSSTRVVPSGAMT